jgi:hypothetical protein
MGRETSVAMRNMRGLSQNGKAIEAEARKSAPIRLFGSVSSLNRRFSGAPKIAPFGGIEQIAEFFTPGKTLIFYSKWERIGRGNSMRSGAKGFRGNRYVRRPTKRDAAVWKR